MVDLTRRTWWTVLLVGSLAALALLAFATGSTRAGTASRSPSAVQGQSVTRLPDGNWLLLGGRTETGGVSGQAVVLDMTLQKRQVLSQGLNVPRAGQSAAVLPDGSVLVLGGVGASGQPVTDVERYHPDSQQFEDIGDIGISARVGQTATLLSDGQLLIAGGTDVSSLVHADAQLLDTYTLRAANGPSMSEARSGQQAQLLPSGDVLLWGGTAANGQPAASAELYSAAGERFQTLSADAARALLAQDQSVTLPQIAATTPQSDGTEVGTDVRLSMRFSKPLEAGSLTDQTVTLIGPSGPVDATVTAAEGGLLAFLIPRQQLLPGSRYTLFLQGAHDGAGRALPFAAVDFQTVMLAATPVKPRTTPAMPPADRVPDDSDGELWIPARRNMTGVWRSGQSSLARNHVPKRSSVAKTFYGKSKGKSLPEAPAGVTAVAGQVMRLNGTPLANVSLSIGTRRVVTDGNGEFLLTDVPSGTQVLVIDGSTADTGSRHYGHYEYRATVNAGKTNVLPFVIWMTRLDARNAVQIPSPTTAETVVTNPRIPGLELHIPAGTVIRNSQGQNVTEVTITPIPVDQPPFPLPNHQVPVYFTIQPGGAHLQGLTAQSAKGARLIYPNFAGMSAGARVDFWNYDPGEKGWYVYGQGTVSSDAKQVVPDPNVVIYEFTGAMIAVPSAAGPKGPPPGDSCHSGPNSPAQVADPVDCYTGLFLHNRTDLTILDTLPVAVSRSYRSGDTQIRSFGYGTSLSYDMFLVGDINPYTYQDLILPDGSRVHFSRISAGTSYSDAVYTTVSPGMYFGAKLTWSPSAFAWVMALPNGTVYTFKENTGSSVGRCGAIIGLRDRYGNALTFARDSNCNLTSVTSPNGRRISFSYDTANRITKAADDIGRTVTYQYDPSGNLAGVTDPAGKTESYTYDSSHHLLTVTDKRGHVMVTNVYDANGRVSQQTYADGATGGFSYTLDTNNAVTQMDFTNERGVVKRVQFNAAGYPTTIIKALGRPEQQTFSYTRDPATNLAQSVTDPLGRVTTYQYDSFGNVVQLTLLSGTPSSATWTYTYESTFQRLTGITDPAGHTRTYHYDALGNLTSAVDPLGNTDTMTYNAAGQMASSTRSVSGNALTVSMGYNSGVLASITDGLNRTTQYFSDSVGRIVTIRDPGGNLAHIGYDDLDRVTQMTDPMGNTVQYSYDENGNLLTVTDARGNITTFSYDVRDRPSSRKDPLNHQVSYSYDAGGNRTQVQDRNGQVAGYAYDSLDRLTSAGFGAALSSPSAYTDTIAYTWDAGNRPTQIADSVGGTITQSFDGFDRVLQEQIPQGQVSYTYYPNGLRQSMTVQGYGAVAYTYDNADRLTRVAQGGAAVDLSYDSADRRTSLTLPNGVQVSYGYDNASQLTGMTYQQGTISLGNLTYTYDLLGRRSSEGGTLAGVTLPPAVDSASYDAGNRLTNWGSLPLTYDNNGNLLTQGTSTYSWNDRGQLTSTSDGAATFAYDAFGRRVARTISGTNTTYQYDAQNPVTVNGDFLLSGLRLDEIYARVSAGSTASFLTDAVGSTLSLLDGGGANIASYTYEPYGVTSQSGSADTSFRFTGREDDGASNLYFYRARYYSPRLGRFISEDPIGLVGGTNGYAYAGANPITRLDPLGLSWQSGALCFLKGAGVGAGSALAIGILSAGAVTLGAPIAAVTLGLGGLAIAGGIVTGSDIGVAIYRGNWDRLAYDLGGLAGGVAAGGLGGRAIAEGVNGVRSPPWSWDLDKAQAYNRALGDRWQWLGTGPNPASAGFSAGAAGSGVATGVGAGSCGCN